MILVALLSFITSEHWDYHLDPMPMIALKKRTQNAWRYLTQLAKQHVQGNNISQPTTAGHIKSKWCRWGFILWNRWVDISKKKLIKCRHLLKEMVTQCFRAPKIGNFLLKISTSFMTPRFFQKLIFWLFFRLIPTFINQQRRFLFFISNFK